MYGMTFPAIESRDVRSAMSWIAAAIKYENDARDVFHRVKRMERKLIRLTGNEIKLLPARAGA